MRLLVTAGNTISPIDKVRGITNIFSGRTGANIATQAALSGHAVVLLTSRPETISEAILASGSLAVRTYRTFDELDALMASEITSGTFDAIVHCAAVSDYTCVGVYAPHPGTTFNPETQTWSSSDATQPALTNRAAGKVKSNEPELWMRLVQAPKLVDRIRTLWRFQGILVKFKLEVDIDDQTLLARAEVSRMQSGADLMVANTLEGMTEWALVGPNQAGLYERLSRPALAPYLIERLERLTRSPG